MVSERLINRFDESLTELAEISGGKERTGIVPNLEVIDAAPGITGFIIVEDSKDGDYITAATVPGMIYANGDLVNVLFIEGTEPIAYQHGPGSGGVAFAVDRVYRPDFTATVLTGDNSNDVTLTAGDLIIPDDIVHSGDADTLISATDDKWTIEAGGLEMAAFIEAATDEVVINDGQVDINFRVEGDTEENLLFTDAGNDRIGIFTNAPVGTVHLFETYTDTTTHQAMRIEQTWSPATTSGNVFPTALDLVPTYDSTHTPAAASFLTSFRLFAEVANSGVINIRNIDLLSTNSGAGTVVNIDDIFIRAVANSGGGAITQYRAILISETTAATTNIGIFQLGSSMINTFIGDMRIGTNNTGGKLFIDQNDTVGARPPVFMRQRDVSEEFISFRGSAAAATLTQSIVDEADVTTATRQGWLKVFVQDDGNRITDQAYFVPIYTLA